MLEDAATLSGLAERHGVIGILSAIVIVQAGAIVMLYRARLALEREQRDMLLRMLERAADRRDA